MSEQSHPAGMMDSHQHFWRLQRGDYGWLKPEMTALYRDFEPEHLAPLLAAAGIESTILVQAAPTVEETRFLLSLADRHAFIASVVGWIDFEDPHSLYALDELCTNKKFVGVRPMVQDIEDPEWLLRPFLARAVDAVMAHDLTFDALIRPQHLRTLLRFCAKHPKLRVVLDHAAKPNIAAQEFEPWAANLKELARETSVFCKLSGLVTEAGSADQTTLTPYVDHLLDCFGPERLMWGSDWPVCETVCSYQAWFDLSRRLLSKITAREQDMIFGEVARKAYPMRDSQRTGRSEQITHSPTPLPPLLLLHPTDNVFVARRLVNAGETISVNGEVLNVSMSVPLGHKIARYALQPGTLVFKYGAPIGSMTQHVAAGDHVHLHNMKSDYLPTHTRQTRARES
jgi:L-fuconolactonase